MASLRFSRTASIVLTSILTACWSSAQTVPDGGSPPAEEQWNVYYQATSIGSTHPGFPALYSGAFSLQPHPEAEVSLTTTLFLGFRFAHNTQIYVNPEIAGGRGFSGVNGLANQYNGELPRVGSATPKPYLARGFITHDFSLGEDSENISPDANQLAGSRPLRRYTVAIGRFTVTDFFDNNRFSHDPRTQFLGWATMYNGAWDYPADTRGYTWGWVHELHLKDWSFRYGSAAMPRVANGPRFDRRLFRDRGDVGEAEYRYAVHDQEGAVRLLGYVNHAQAGDYAEAIRLSEQTGTRPDVTATRRVGTAKYGAGISADQELAKDVGVFLRLGWNDGKTESFAFTAVDRLVSSGVSIGGNRWHRSDDNAGTALTVSGISGVHANYLAHGGYDFLIGDGALNYGHEYTWESYYNARLFKGFFASFDAQHYWNPAYNRDRGPVWVANLRLHLELGK